MPAMNTFNSTDFRPVIQPFDEATIDLIDETGGIPPEHELGDLGIAHGSIPV